MTLRETGAYPASEVEGLISALTGVRAARVTMNEVGRVNEIHILADARTHPKQIVRNVESALNAGLGLTVDRRFISVAQMREGAEDGLDEPPDGGADAASGDSEPPHAATTSQQPEQPAAPTSSSPAQHAPPAAEPAAPAAAPQQQSRSPDAGRYIFVGYDARTQPDLETACRVTIRHENEVYSGTGSGPSTPLGRAQSAARAVFSAIATAQDSESLALEGVTLVESHGRTYVLVAAHAIIGRSTVALTGTAGLQRSPEEAAILASLQATNRWNELNG